MAISKIPVGARDMDDTLIWPWNTNGIYSVKSAYSFIRDRDMSLPEASVSEDFRQNKALWRDVWNIQTNPRVRNFVWRAMHNSLPTLENLIKRHKAVSCDCNRCGQSGSLEHVLFLCPFSQMVWRVSDFGYFPRSEGFSNFPNWWHKTGLMMEKEGRNDAFVLITQVCYCLWRARNALIFDNAHKSPQSIWEQARNMCFVDDSTQVENQVILQGQVSIGNSGEDSKWDPPNSNEIKVNCFAVKNFDREGSGIGIITRDCLGNVKGIGRREIQPGSGRIAEAEAIRFSLDMIKNFNWVNCIIECSNRSLVHSISNNRFSSWKTKAVEQDVAREADFLNCKVKWASIKKNYCARWIAAQNWLGILQSSFLPLACNELSSLLDNEKPIVP